MTIEQTPRRTGASGLLNDPALNTPVPETRADAFTRLGEMLSDPAYLKNPTPEMQREIMAARQRATRFDPAQLGVGVRPIETAVAQLEHEMARAKVEMESGIAALRQYGDVSEDIANHIRNDLAVPKADHAVAAAERDRLMRDAKFRERYFGNDSERLYGPNKQFSAREWLLRINRTLVSRIEG